MIIRWHLVTGLRSLASTTSHQTIEGAKISASSTLRKIIRGLEHREFFRNRTDDEIRDIYVTRYEMGRWTAGKAVHDDGWQIHACPINGPAVSAHGRITGVVLGFLPPAVAGVLLIVSPEHVRLLVDDPLGVRMVLTGIVLQVIGVLIIRRIVNVEY